MAKHHEWHDTTDDGDVRYVRAQLFGGRWSFQQKLKSVGEWQDVAEPDLEDLHALRDQLWRKYTRGRVPHEQVKKLDALIERREQH